MPLAPAMQVLLAGELRKPREWKDLWDADDEWEVYDFVL
jgi:hypothetical protein